MSQHPDNVKRGERALVSLKAHPMFGEEPDEINIRDLLTDLRHYCDTQGLDFSDEDDAAQGNYFLEVNDPSL